MVRILIVEDNREFATEIVERLQIMGYQVEEAHSAKEALGSIVLHLPNVVLLDIMLNRDSNTDGFSVAQKLEEQAIPYFFISSYYHLRKESEEKNLLPRDFLRRSISDEDLRYKIELVLREKQKEVAQLPIEKIIIEKTIVDGRGKGNKIVPIVDIVYLQANNNDLILFLKNGEKENRWGMTLKEFMETYPNPNLLRVSKFHAINLDYVSHYKDKGDAFVELCFGDKKDKIKQISIGDSFLGAFKARIPK